MASVNSESTATGRRVEILVNDAMVEKALRFIEERTSSVSLVEFLQGKAVPFLQTRAAQRFASEGDDASGRWAPLQGTTQFRRKAGREAGWWDVGDAHPINQRTHELMNYIANGAGNTAPFAYGARLLYPGENIKRFPNLADKIKTAQKGSGKPRTVARPVLAIGPTDVAFLLTALQDHILAGAVFAR